MIYESNFESTLVKKFYLVKTRERKSPNMTRGSSTLSNMEKYFLKDRLITYQSKQATVLGLLTFLRPIILVHSSGVTHFSR